MSHRRSRTKAQVVARNERQKRSPHFKHTMIAAAVAMAMLPEAQALASNAVNIETYFKPGNRRALVGVEAVFAMARREDSLWFTDIKFTGTNKETMEANVALGRRWFNDSNNWLIGGFGSFDKRQSRSKEVYDQLTFGFEALSDTWDFRANYYYPITDKQYVGVGNKGWFSGTSLIRSGVYEEALAGGDIEIGRLLPVSNEVETRAFLSGYRFSGDLDTTVTGMGARLEVRPQQNLIFGLQVQQDDQRDVQYYAEIRYSFGHKSKSAIRTLNERMMDPVRRDPDIVTTGPTDSENRNFGTLYSDDVIHIDNEGGEGGGDGSATNPYETVGDCNAGRCEGSEGALIFVHEGSSPYDTESFSLEYGQTLWGQGYQLLDILDDGNGDPLELGSSNMPTLEGGEFDGGVSGRLNDSNTVMGLRFAGNATGILADNNTDFNIHDNEFDLDIGNVAIEINTYAEGAEGSESTVGTISNNYFYATEYGVAIVATAEGSEGATVTQDVTISNNGIYGLGYGVVMSNSAKYGAISTQTVSLEDNWIVTDNPAVLAYNDAQHEGSYGVQNVNLDGNVVLSYSVPVMAVNLAGDAFDEWEDGVPVGGDAGSGYGSASQTITMSDNMAYGVAHGLYAHTESFGYGVSTQTIMSENDQFTGFFSGMTTTVFSKYGSSSTQNVTLDDSVVFGYGVGVLANASAGEGGYTEQNLTIENGTRIDGYGIGLLASAGKYLEESPYSLGSIVGEVEYGDLTGFTEQTVTMDSSIIGSKYEGLDNINAVGAYFVVSSDYGSTSHQTVTLTDNVIDSAYGNGLIAVADDYGVTNQTATLSGNTITSGSRLHDPVYGTYSLNIVADGGDAPYGGNVTQDVTLSDNMIGFDEYAGEGYGIPVRIDADGDYGLVDQDVSFSGDTLESGVYGPSVYVNNDGSFSDTFQDVELSNTNITEEDAVDDGAIVCEVDSTPDNTSIDVDGSEISGEVCSDPI